MPRVFWNMKQKLTKEQRLYEQNSLLSVTRSPSCDHRHPVNIATSYLRSLVKLSTYQLRKVSRDKRKTSQVGLYTNVSLSNTGRVRQSLSAIIPSMLHREYFLLMYLLYQTIYTGPYFTNRYLPYPTHGSPNTLFFACRKQLALS